MKRSGLILFLIVMLGISFSTSIFAQQKSIRLIDPQGMWRTDKATMDSLTVIIKPEGAYTMLSYMVNISTDRTRFNSITDTLEIESYFQLPENAIVNDSWLWVEDTLVFADLIDRWTANSIYEDIVRRTRRDPSIWYMNSPINYEFRLFPLAGTKYRKFLISFMIPNRIENGKFVLDVPDLWFGLVNQPNFVNVVFVSDKNYSSINYPFSDNDEFLENTNNFFGKHHFRQLRMADFMQSRKFVYSGPIKDGLHLSKYKVGNERYYQLALDFGSLMSEREPAKHLFIFEYVSDKSRDNRTVTLSRFLDNIRGSYKHGDQINIVFTNPIGQISMLSDDWILIDNDNPAIFDDKIKQFSLAQTAGFVNLPAMIYKAIEFTKEDENDPKIIIFSNSDDFGDFAIANQLLNQIRELTQNKIVFYALDHANSATIKKYKINNLNYHGNHYFYHNLAKMTRGEYFNIWSFGNNLINLFSQLNQSLFSYPKDINYHILTGGGFAYQSFEPLKNLSKNGTLVNVGKYVGDDDFTFRLTYLIDNQPYFKDINLKNNEITDNLKIPQIWMGNYIKSIEFTNPQSNKTVIDIIELSMAYRVLSRYTAFLALEPWMRDSIFGQEQGNQDVTDVLEKIEKLSSEFSITVNPNPATINANIILATGIETSIESIILYNIQGRIVKTLNIPGGILSGDYTLFWDLTDDSGNRVPAGIYYVIVNTGFKSFTQKFIVN